VFIRRIISAGILFFICVVTAYAFDVPSHDGYVTDVADVISESEEEVLTARIHELEDTMTVEIAVLTVLTTEGEDIAEVAFEVGNTWGVGKDENDNGLVIVVAVDDREWFIATGYGLEGALPDAIVKRIGEYDFPPYFREGDFSGGILAGLDDMELYMAKDPSIVAFYDEEEEEYDYDAAFEKEMEQSMWFMILLTAAFLKTFWVGFSKKNQILISLFSNIVILVLGILFTYFWYLFVVMIMSILMDLAAITAGKGGGSGGGWSSGSSSGGWTNSSSNSSSSWGSSSGGSSGSFGGGSFGGGGSGGRW